MATIKGKNLQDLVRATKKVSKQDAKTIEFNLTGLGNYKKDVVITGAGANDQEAENRQLMIDNAGTLEGMFEDLERQLDSQGYTTEYEYDADNNEILCYLVDKGNSQRIQADPLQVKLINKLGQTGKKKTRGTVGLQVVEGTNGRTALMTTGELAVNTMLKRVKSPNGKLTRANLAASSFNTQTSAVARQVAQRKQAQAMRQINKTASAVRNFGEGSNIHVVYTADSPQARARAARQVDYSQAMESLVSLMDEIKRKNKLSIDTRATAAKIRQNMAVKGGNLEAGIESVFRKDPRFQKALQLLKDLKSAGISYQEVSDESWGKDVASFATHGAVDVRGSGRKNVRGQLSNNARLAPRALKKRDTAGINKRYYAMAVTSQTAKDAKLNITTEGGVAVNKGTMPEMDRLQARRFYTSDKQIDRAIKKRKKGLQKRLDYLTGSNLQGELGNLLVNAQTSVSHREEALKRAEKKLESAQKGLKRAQKQQDSEKIEKAEKNIERRQGELKTAEKKLKTAQQSLQKAESRVRSNADKQRVAREELAFLDNTSNRDAIAYAHLRAKGFGGKKVELKDLKRAQAEITAQPDLTPRYENGEYSMAVVRAITTEVGDKLLGSGGIKDTITQAVSPKTSARIAEKAGLKIGGKALDISAYTAAPDDINPRKFGPLAASIAQTIPNILFDNIGQYGIDKAKLQEWVKKTPLGKILSFNKESGFSLNDKEWRKLEQNPQRLAKYFKKLFDFFTTLNDATSQIDGLMSEGAHGDYADKASRLKELVPLMRAAVGGVEAFQEVDDKGNLTSSGYRFTTDRLMLTTLNPASEYDYMGPSEKKRILGETERTSMTSMVGSMGLKDKKAAKTLLAPYQLTDDQIRKQKENEALARSIITGSAATVTAFPKDNSGVSGQMDKKRVTVGYGSGYDVDLSAAGYDLGDPDSMSFEWANGRVTKESYQKSALAFVRARVKEKVAQFLGKKVDDITQDELNQFSVFLDTSTKEGERFALKTYDSPDVANGAKMQMRAAKLDLFGGGAGSGVTEAGIALNNALTKVMASGIIEEGLAADPTDASLQEDASDFAEQANLGVLDYFSELHNQAYYNKNAEYIKNNTTESRDYFWGAANIEAHENAEDNVVYVSPDMFKDIMRTKFGDTKKGKEQFKEFFKVVTGLQDVPEKFEAALDELTQRLKSGDTSILSRVTRFPLDRGGLGDSLFTQLRVKEGEGKTVSMSSAMLKLLSGDTDGDKILAEILGIGPGTDMEGLKALYKEDTKQQILKQSNNATRALAQLQAQKVAQGKTVVEDATITAWASEYNDEINQMLVGPLKDLTGQFSNQFQAVRDMLADFGLDEGSIGKKKSTGERAEIGEGLLLRALTSQITQQAISAKKVAEFFVANADKKAEFDAAKDEETKAEILREALRGSVEKAKTLLELLRQPDFFDAQKGHEARAIFKENLRTFGIVDDKGRLNDQTQEIVMAQLNSLVPKGKSRLSFFKQLFPEANIKADQLDEYDEKGNLISIAKDLENRFVPTIDQIIAAFLRLETVIRRNVGKEGIAGVLTKGRKNVRKATRENVVNTAYYAYGKQPYLDYNLPESSATGGGGTGGGGNLGGPINAQQVTITAQSVQLTGTLAGGGGGRAGITLRESLEAGDAQLLGQNPYWRVSTYAHQLAKNQAYIGSEDGRWSVIKGRHEGKGALAKSSPLTLKEEAIANGFEKEYYADIYRALAAPQGTYMHAAQEFMSNVQTLMNEGRLKGDRITVSSMDEARSLLAGIDKTDARYNRARDIQGTYDKARDEFVALRDSTYDPTDIGTDKIAERFRDENLEKRADSLRGLILSGKYDDIATEYSNSQKLADGRIVTGHADYLAGKQVGDEYYATLGDFKNLTAGKKIDAAYIAQVLTYQRSAGQLMAAFDRLGVSSETTADDIINWLQGGGTTEQKELLNNVGIKIGKDGTLHNFDPKAFDIIKKLYFENGGNLEAAMAHMQGELDVAYDDGAIRKITGINYNDISDTLKKYIAGQADTYEGEVALKELQEMANKAYGYQSKKGSPAFQKALAKLKDLYDAQFQLQKYEREKEHTLEGTQEYKRLEELIKATQAKVEEAKAAIKAQKETGEGGGTLTDEEKKKLDEREKEDQEKLAKIKADDENLEKQRNARTAEYIKLMQKAIELKEKLYRLDKQIEAAEKKGDDTHVLKAKRKGLEDERKELVSGMKEITGTTSSRWSAIGGRGQKEAESGAFNQKELRRIDIARHQKKTLLSGERAVYDAEFGAQNQVDTEGRYQKLLNERLRLESKGMSAQHKLQLSYNGQEKGALQEVIRLTQQKIALLDKELGILRESGFMRDDQVADIEREYQLERAINVAGEAGKNGGAISVWGMMKNDMSRAMARVFDYGIAMRALNSIPQVFRKIYDLTTQLDSALTNLRIVTGENNEGAQELMLTYNKLGKELGATTQQIAESANEWLRQGYSAQEAGDLIDASMKLSKLGMIESSEATQYLTSMLKGFKMEAENALEVVDRLTSVDVEAAVSAGGIAEALSRTATSAQLAGLSLDESIGMVTVIGEVTQKSMESVGESVKTLLSRYGNVKAGVFAQMGLDDDGETTDNINDIEKVLGKLGIPIRSSNLEMRAIGDVLDELADKWVSLDTVSKNAVATAMAGVRQRENFNVLMENYSRAEELAEKSADSAGTANEKYEAYADSFEAAMSRLTAAWEEFTLKLQSSAIVKTGIKIVTFFVENLDKIASLLATIATTTAGIKMQRGQSKLFNKIWAGGQPLRMFNRGVFGEKLGGKFNTYLGVRAEARKQRRGKEGLFYWDETDSTQRAKDKLSGPFAAWNKNNSQNALTQALQENTAAITGNTAAIRGETVSGQTQDMLKGFDAEKYKKTIWYKGKQGKRGLMGRELVSANMGIDPTTGKLTLLDNDGNFIAGKAGKPTRAMRKAYNKEVFGTGFGKPSFGQGMGAALGGVTAFLGGVMSMNEVGGQNSLFSSLINQTGQTVEADAVDKVINGATKGGITAAASLIPGIGPVIGPLLGEFVGGPLGDLITYLRHEDELKRKERVAEAKEQLEMLSSISDKLTGMEGLMDNEDWDADDYKQARESAEAIADELKGTKNGEENLEKWLRSMNIVDESGTAITDFDEAIKYLYSDDAEIRTKIYQAASLAVLEDIRDNTAASQEEERYNANNIETQWFIDDLVTDDMIWEDGGLGVQNDKLRQALKDNADKLKDKAIYDNASGQFKVLGDTNEEIAENLQDVIDVLSGDSRVSNATLKFLQSKLDNVENAVDTLDDLDKQNRQTSIELAYTQSGVGNLTPEELEGETVDSLISQIANEIEGARDQAGRITKDYYDDIKQYLRERQEVSSVFAGKGPTVQELKEIGEKWTGKVAEITAPATGKRPGTVSSDWTEWEDALKTNNLQKIWELAGYTGEANTKQASEWLNRLYGTVAQADSQNIKDIAWALGVTEEALRNIDALGDIDLSDALLAPDEIREKYASAVGLWQTLIKEGTLSAEELEQVYSQYPETVGKSFDEIREILQGKITGEQEALYQQALFGDIMESEDYLDQIVEELEGNENLSQYQDKINEIKNAGSLSAARAIIANLSGSDWSPLIEALQAAMDDTIQYELYDDEYLNSYMSYYSDYLSEQIDALEEQKDAIGAVNEERKKELDLIKAEMALENAGKEKKKVWREGVGWTWVTDEEGVKEAQENLEEKQTEKRQDDVQLQIDYLEAQKEFIEGLPDREQMENYKQTFGEFNSAISDGAKIVSMFTNRLQEFNIKDLFWGEGGYNQATLDKAEEKGKALEAAGKKLKDAVNRLQNVDEHDVDEYYAAISDYNSAVSGLQTAYSEAKDVGVNVSDEKYSQYYLQATTNSDTGFYEGDASKVSDAGQITDIEAQRELDRVLLVGSGLGDDDQNYGALSEEADTFWESRLKQNEGAFRFKQPKKDGTYPDSWEQFAGTLDEAKQKIASLPAYTVFNLGLHESESKKQKAKTTGYSYKDTDGVLKYIDFSQMSGGTSGGRWDRSDKGAAQAYDREFGSWSGGKWGSGEYSWHAAGTLSSSEGPTFINEEGTEALITPQGTLTALPAKTGVLPADITENLWKLGGIAPSLISTLSSLTSSPYSSSNAGSTVNNSGTFIDNLSMQIYPTKDYDMDKFLEEARAKARLSRNNN